MNSSSPILVHAMRLKPGEDLRAQIENYVQQNNIAAGWMVTCAGSLTNYSIRFANMENGSTGTGHFEIVSLTGTVSKNGNHLHISISDSTGNTIGGHLLTGCIVYTTAEIIIESTTSLNFKREKDGSTPWEELQIEKVKDQKNE
ncbi:MAG: PPC domain-containing DNA-binding protein [Ferruginibacter sp.]